MGIESIELILRKKKKITSYYRFSTSNGKVRNLRKISISHIYRAKYENNIFCLVFSLFLAQLDYCRDLSLQIYHLCCQHETLLYFVIRFQKQFFNETTIKTIYITFFTFFLKNWAIFLTIFNLDGLLQRSVIPNILSRLLA